MGESADDRTSPAAPDDFKTTEFVALLATPFLLPGVIMRAQEEKQHRKLLAALNGALSVRTHAAISDRVTLRDAVCAYLAAEQARGSTVESVVQTVKAILRKAEEGAADSNDELANWLVDSCLDSITSGLRRI